MSQGGHAVEGASRHQGRPLQGPLHWSMTEILLIEDSESDAQLLQRTLKQAGVGNPVRWLSSGEEAMAYLMHAIQSEGIGPPLPSILFIDLKLPGLSGFEILEQVRSVPVLAKALRVVLSSLDDTQSIKMAYTAGAQSFLVKPPNPVDITELINSFPGYWELTGRSGASPTGPSPWLIA